MFERFIAATVVRPVTTTMITVAVLLFGLVAATRLPLELLPDLTYPTITVQTTLPDAAPAEVEELVTRPVEERVGAVPGLIRVESVSREGESSVVLDFAWGTRIDQAMADVREKLDRVELPVTATRPVVLRYDPSTEPVMRLALRVGAQTGPLRPEELAALRQAADRTVKRELEKLAGVAAVELHGGEEDEVLVELHPDRLAALGVGSEDVVAALQRDNVNRPGGAITESKSRYLIRTVHEARTPDELGDIIVRSEQNAQLRIREVATVRRAPIDREEISLYEGAEIIELTVYREGDANLVTVADTVERELGRLALRPGHEVVVLADRSQFIESAIREVQSNTLLGGLLAVAVLLFFLRDLRSTLVIAVAIPISVLATFIPLRALDVSLNVMSLGGLALGVGMLVDNSIVVLESVARVRETDIARGRSRSRRDWAVMGASEVAPSVFASTLTTVAVFFPMAFVEGVAGQLVRDLSYAVSFSLMSSLLVSLTLVPVLLGLGDRHTESEDAITAPRSVVVSVLTWPVAKLTRLLGLLIGGVAWLLAKTAGPLTASYDALEARYPAVLGVALRHRGVVLLGAVAVCIVSVRLAEQRGQTLIPPLDQDEFHVQVALPRGASLERTTATMRALSLAVADDPAVDKHFARVGSVAVAGTATGGVLGTHLGQLSIKLNADVRERAEVEQRLFERIAAGNPEREATLELGHPALLSFAPPIEVQIFSEDFGAATAYTDRLLTDLRGIDELHDVVPDDLEGRPEVRVHFDRERLGRLGVAVSDAASAVARSIQGEIATQLYAADQQLDVRVQLPRVDRSNVEDVARIQVAVVEGRPVLLASVAEVTPGVGPAEIRRIDGRQGLRIRARTTNVDLEGVAGRVREVLGAHAGDDARVEAVVAGQAEEMQASLQSLLLAGALSIFLVYVVMASSFESLLHPLLILFTVPLAVAGVALGIYVANIPVSAMVGIGVVVLGGIVVNNAIVLIHAVNDRRGMGMGVGEALLTAGSLRLRPILMTTATTVLGLVPMALGLGDGAALRQPLAVAIIGGLSLATLLTLVVIPCAYSLLPGRTREAWGRRADDL